RVMQMLLFTKAPPVCEAIMFSFDNNVLGSNRPISEIAREMSC
ncbi:cobalt-precorrin-5B (C(1))-methyltransferase, partial [Klebsiella quasipneumoniae]|nr:cobalt-precorrin-5B (C(1))-methyltransferase [Klebsiella quasipneumoniae]